MQNESHSLGTVKASEQLIRDLYIDLRRKILSWASITQQTAQARMGYIGQHLVSVVTSYPGARSGARGKDLILPGGQFAEIKTCYRVDQLGYCNKCDAAVSSLEANCPTCKSKDIKRNDDSKWLIGIRNEDELNEILDPLHYYLVLFDFVAIDTADTTIRASIWRVDPLAPGFALCMIDYYFNIRAKSTSKAPFNLWPFQLKFDLMRPVLIYRSLIRPDDAIETQLFPGRDDEQLHPLASLVDYAGSKNLDEKKLGLLIRKIGLKVPPVATKTLLLQEIERGFKAKKISPSKMADFLASALYSPDTEKHQTSLPAKLKEKFSKVPLW